MRASVVMVLSFVVVLSSAAHAAAPAQGQRGQKRQNNGAPAGIAQAGFQQREGGVGNVGAGTGQLAQIMLANFDQNGDAALNLIELQVALDALRQRLCGQEMMNQFRHGQPPNGAWAGGSRGPGQGRAGKGGGGYGGGNGGAKGGRGR